MQLSHYVSIARPSHWVKNLFILPGIVFALALTKNYDLAIIANLLLGTVSVCLITSSNYVINEWLDAGNDCYHPLKKNRPSVVANLNPFVVYSEYVLLVVFGLVLATHISMEYFYVSLFFVFMGLIYNIKPFRTKDMVYIDVLSESFNNPLRLLLGWLIVLSDTLPPSSLLFGYWMGGAFLMAVKRYAELRFINNLEIARRYRRSFLYYSEKSLLISSFFYAMCSTFFIGIFLIKNRIELLISVPFIAGLFCIYLYIGMNEESVAQRPEHLFREKYLLIYSLFVGLLILFLMFVEIPLLNYFLQNQFVYFP